MKYGKTTIIICKNGYNIGNKVTATVVAKMRELFLDKNDICMIFPAGESQITFLNVLAKVI